MTQVETNLVLLTSIRLDGGTQPRAELNTEHISELTEILLEGGTFKDSIIVFYDGTNYWLADGFHRVHAAMQAGIDAIETDVRQGTQEDAIEHSCGVNAFHGLKRKHGDIERAIKRLRELPKWKYRTHREIADHIHVSRRRVSQVLQESEGKISQSVTNQPVEPKEGMKEVGNFPTNKDKQNSVKKFFKDFPHLQTLSNREIARRCGVDHKTVASIREELFPAPEPEPELTHTEEKKIEPEPTPEMEQKYESELEGKVETELAPTPEPEPGVEPVTEPDIPSMAEEEATPETETKSPLLLDATSQMLQGTQLAQTALEDEIKDVPLETSEPESEQSQVELEAEQVVEFTPAPEPTIETKADLASEPESEPEPELTTTPEPESKAEPQPKLETQEERKTQKSASLSALQSSKSNEWYTPMVYIEAARKVMGGIDLDPASCEEANHIVQAKRYYTEGNDGLAWDWWADEDETIPARVFLNPPYGFDENGKSNQEVWSDRLICEYETVKSVREAVLLVNANTEAKWFQPLYNYLICFTNHRIRFWSNEGEENQPTQGNAFIYFSRDRASEKRFIDVFSAFGTVVRKAS